MTIFNSLGSNYNFRFALKSLFASNKKTAQTDLESLLQKKYGGEVALLYKAREALTLALETLLLSPKSPVAVNGFTCYAVYQAIIAVGLTPHYLDITPTDLNFSATELERALAENPEIKVVIIQNTLGYPAEITDIETLCRQHNLIIIEDLAHSPGARYQDGREVGTIGDFTILSFSQDKMIDSISGGALIIRNKEYRLLSTIKIKRVNYARRIKDRLYPLLTWLVRHTYASGLGKIFHRFLNQLDILSRPIDNAGPGFHQLSAWQCALAKNQLDNLATNLQHRKKIAERYAQKLDPKLVRRSIIEKVTSSANLRFPIFVESGRDELLIFLKNWGVHLADIWYDAAISPANYLPLTNYQPGECPKAETTAGQIMNLPTHANISPAQADQLADLINLWLKSTVE